MLGNYLRIGLRNLLKNKLFSLINTGGMVISITTFLIIALFVADELKFDRHIADVSQKYRVYTELFYDDGTVRKGAMIPPIIGPTLAGDYPEVESYARFLNFNSNALFEAGEKKSTEFKGGFGDASLFEMFSLRLIEGDPKTALKSTLGIAISESLARKYFDGNPALGQTIQVLNTSYTVEAVYEDFSAYSHLQLNYILAMENFTAGSPDRMKNWTWSQFHTYIKVRPGTNVAELEGKLKDFAERNAWPHTKQIGMYYLPHLMPLKDIHLHAYDHQWDIAVRGNIHTIYILTVTAFFIIVIAILNFVNLSTARSAARVKEVGVRKVMGAFRTQLINQFISESVIIAVIAVVIGVIIAGLLVPALNSFTEKTIPTQLFLNPFLSAGMVAFAVVIGVAAGAYPAFFISSHRPVEALSNKNSGRLSGRNLLRKGLVIFQFVLSFFLIIASLIVSDQHTYMRTKDMGFDKDNLVVVSIRGDMRRNLEATKRAFLDHQSILGGTMGYGLPGQAFAGDGVKDKATGKNWPISMLTVDHDYINTLGLTVIAGRDFSREISTDEKHAYILSETAARMLGHTNPDEALGHEISWDRWDAPDSLKEGKVIGVVRDVHLNSLRDRITPVILHIFPFAYSTLTMRVKSEDIPATIAHLESTWKKFNSEWPFEYKFLDENFDKLYKSEERLATLFKFFTGFAIFVACLGLLGLVIYHTSQRYKEISIRKVLGASEIRLVVLLGKTYVLLIAIAFLLAAPFSYYAANEWLQGFAYRVDITPFLFVKAGLFILVISLVTVSIQSFQAARNNPVEALKEQ